MDGLTKVLGKGIIGCGLAIAVFGPAPKAHADWHDRSWRHRPRPIVFNWCSYARPRYVAPVVEVVTVEPHRTVVIDGVVYHEYNGVYYKGGMADYAMVPVHSAPGATAAATTVGGKEIQGTEVVNIPNANGSYTPVTLQAAKDGTYLGPQGEVYTTKPGTDQLKAMYAK